MSWAGMPPDENLHENLHENWAQEAAARDAEADLLAMIAAGRELGPEMDRALAESYLSRHDEPPTAAEPLVAPAPETPFAFESQSDERSFAPWLIPLIFLLSLLLFAAPFHVGGFFFVIPLIFMLNRNRAQHQRISAPGMKYGSLSPASDPTLLTPSMPVTLSHPGARFDVVLMHPGVNKIATIKEVRMLTGLGLREAKALTDFAPRTLLQDVSADRANVALAQLSAVGAHVALQPSGQQSLSSLPPVAPTPPATPPQQWPAPPGTDVSAAPPANPAG